jgi:hypothetical protein
MGGRFSERQLLVLSASLEVAFWKLWASDGQLAESSTPVFLQTPGY